jgi:hypothetical protein
MYATVRRPEASSDASGGPVVLEVNAGAIFTFPVDALGSIWIACTGKGAGPKTSFGNRGSAGLDVSINSSMSVVLDDDLEHTVQVFAAAANYALVAKERWFTLKLL